MNVIFTEDVKGKRKVYQARAEQSFSTGDGHGDFCLNGYGETKHEALDNLRQLAQKMVRQLDTLKGP